MKSGIAILMFVFSLSAYAEQGFLAIGTTSLDSNDANKKIITLCQHSDSKWYSCADSGDVKKYIYSKISYDAKNRQYVALGEASDSLPRVACLKIDSSNKWVDCSPSVSSGIKPGFYSDLAHNETGDLVIIGSDAPWYMGPNLIAACRSPDGKWRNCSPNNLDNIVKVGYGKISYGNGEWVAAGMTDIFSSQNFAAACFNIIENKWKDCSSPLEMRIQGITYDALNKKWITVGTMFNASGSGTYVSFACRERSGEWSLCGEKNYVNNPRSQIFGNANGESLVLTNEWTCWPNDPFCTAKPRSFTYKSDSLIQESYGLQKNLNEPYYAAAYGQNKWAAVGKFYDIYGDDAGYTISCLSSSGSSWKQCLDWDVINGHLINITFGELGNLSK